MIEFKECNWFAEKKNYMIDAGEHADGTHSVNLKEASDKPFAIPEFGKDVLDRYCSRLPHAD